MKDTIKDNEELEIKKVTVNEINLKKLLDDNFIDKLDKNVENYTLDIDLGNLKKEIEIEKLISIF